MTDKVILQHGWWINIAPLASIENETWVLGIYKKGKKSWITEHAGQFNDPIEARIWALKFIEGKLQEKLRPNVK